MNQWPSCDQAVADLVADVARRLQAGEAINLEAFITEHAEYEEQLRRLLPAMQVLAGFASSAALGITTASPTADEDTAATHCGTLGDFRLIREIGRGGMGVVYEAEQISLNRRVAIKVLPFAAVLEAKQLRRFKNEAQAAAQLHHTNIVPVHFVGSERGVHYYAMQFIEGHTLAQVIRELRAERGEGCSELAVGSIDDDSLHRDNSLPPTSALNALSTKRSTRSGEFYRTIAQLGMQAAEALEHAHDVGIIHRDIKPSNLLLDLRGNLWITDFGLARVQSDANLTMTGDLIGTLRYMSPEQALAKRIVVDHRSDIYSLGVTLYELLTLRSAFSGEDRQEILRQIAFDEPVAPRRVNARVPVELETIVLKAIAKNPSERYATARELADDLDRFLREEPIRAKRPTLMQRARKWSRRHRSAVTTAAVCTSVGAVLVATSWGWMVHQERQRQAEVAGRVTQALQDAALLRGHAEAAQDDLIRWARAVEAAKRAKTLLSANANDKTTLQVRELLLQVEAGEKGAARRSVQREADRKVIHDLEQVRLGRADVLDGEADYRDIDKEYAQVFRAYGIDLDVLDEDGAIKFVRQSAVCSQLTALLDDWALVRRESQGGEDASWKKLLAIAKAADEDVVRNRVRDALEREDRAVLAELAALDETESLPSPTLVFLATALAQYGENEKTVSLLRTASSMRPGDFWIHFTLAVHLHTSTPPQWDQMVQFSRLALAIRPENASVAELLGDALRHKGEIDDSIRILERAIQLKPDLSGPHGGLGLALYDKGNFNGATAAYREAIRLKPDLANYHFNLGNVLRDGWLFDEAIDAYREAIRLKPNYPDAHNNLGVVLFDKGDLDEATAEFREAIRLKPDLARPHFNLGNALSELGNVDEAKAAYREAIRLDPDNYAPYYNLGNVLQYKGFLDDAIAAYRESIRLKAEFADAYTNLGQVLGDKGLLDEAIAVCRESIRLKPDDPEAHNSIGVVLAQKGLLDEAIAAFREAVRLKPDFVKAHINLSICERQVELEHTFARVLSGAQNPSNATERIKYANLCYRKRLFASAARLFQQALTEDPKLAEIPGTFHRYNAACCAALAGCGQGDDAASLDATTRVRWRRQAHDWLRAELDRYATLLTTSNDTTRTQIFRHLQHCQGDADLADVRDADHLASLPEGERDNWVKFWMDVEALVQREKSRDGS
jgi:serine/threonine protein kinase/Flp pilus assembly protein TadD